MRDIEELKHNFSELTNISKEDEAFDTLFQCFSLGISYADQIPDEPESPSEPELTVEDIVERFKGDLETMTVAEAVDKNCDCKTRALRDHLIVGVCKQRLARRGIIIPDYLC